MNGQDLALTKKLIDKYGGGTVSDSQLNSAIDKKIADGTIASGEQLESNVQQLNNHITNHPRGVDIDDVNIGTDKVYSSSKTKSLIDEVANKGTTVEVITNTTRTVIDEKIASGSISASGKVATVIAYQKIPFFNEAQVALTIYKETIVRTDKYIYYPSTDVVISLKELTDGQTVIIFNTSNNTFSQKRYNYQCGTFEYIIGSYSKDTKTLNLNCDYDGDRTFSKKQLYTKVNELENKVGRDGVPSYFDSYLDNKVNEILDLHCTCSNNITTIAFITDFHLGANSNVSPFILKRLSSKLNIDTFIANGDLIDGTSLVDIKNKAKTFKSLFNPLPILCNVGNHDIYYFDRKQYGVYMQQTLANVKTTNYTACNFYYDDDIKKIRYIFLDSESGKDEISQGRWLGEVALNFVGKEDYKIIIASHWPVVSIKNAGAVGELYTFRDIIKAFKNRTTYRRWYDADNILEFDFSQSTQDVLIWLCGHEHWEGDGVLDNTIKVVCCINDSLTYEDGMPIKTKGTITECSFNIITIDLDNNKAYFNIIGAGNNRTFDL